MAAASVKLAERIFPSIADQRLLLIGAGEMIELTATHFAGEDPKSITIANRTSSAAAQLAERFKAEAITLTEMPERLQNSTSSSPARRARCRSSARGCWSA